METSSKVFSSLIWSFLERFGAQIVTFIVSIILARLLDTGVYGIIALVTVFTTILQVFITSGFGNALIQKKDADDIDFSTVFYFNIILSITLYSIMFFSAPLIAKFYCREELIPIVRVISLNLIIAGPKNVLHAKIARKMEFKKFFFATLAGTIGAAVIGIYMAYAGYGVWSLIIQNLFNTIVDTIILWISIKWLPKLRFSFKRLKQLFSYGWKLLISSLLETGYNELRALIIGKKYSSSDLAFYNKGGTFPNLVITNINSAINSVLFPTMSNVQEDKEQVKTITRKAIKTSSYIIWPMMTGLIACATPLVSVLLTDKWIPCVPYMQIFCFTYAFYPIHTANLNAIKALGRSDIFLKLEVLKKIIGLIAILISMWFGVIWMALSLIVTSFTSQIINSFPNKKLLNYSYLEQIKDILPSIILSAIMGGIVYCITFFGLSNWLTLLIQIPLGVIIYVVGSIVLKIESFYYTLDTVKKLFKKDKKEEIKENIND